MQHTWRAHCNLWATALARCSRLQGLDRQQGAKSVAAAPQPPLYQLLPRRRQHACEVAPTATGPTLQQTASPAAQQQAQQQHQMYCLVKNDEVLPCQQPSGPWLEAAPRGAYTTARTVGGSSVFELTFHIERLASSARLMMEADAAAAAAAAAADQQQQGGGTGQQLGAPAPALALPVPIATDPAQLRPRVLNAMRAAVRAYRAASGDADGELKLTVLVTWAGCQQQHPANSSSTTTSSGGSEAAPGNGAGTPGPAPGPAVALQGSGTAGTAGNASSASGGMDVYVHVSPLPPRPQPPVRIVIRGAPRRNAAAKDSEWVRQRKALEREAPPGVNEVVLVGEGGLLYEGLTSNFFAVLDGAVHTAGEGVLAGTVREVALQVALREGMPVVLEPPKLSDFDRWEGCFISSTSRLLLPVDEASMPVEVAEQGEAAAAAAVAAGEGLAGQEEKGQAGPTPDPDPAMRTRRFERGGLVQRLEELVLTEISACSEPLL